MSESIPEVVLRLARRHLPADAAVPVNAPAQPEFENPEPPLESEGVSVQVRVPATSPDRQPAADSPVPESVVTERTPHAFLTDQVHPESLDIPMRPQEQFSASHDQGPQVVPQPFLLHTAGETPAPQFMAAAHADELTFAPLDANSFADGEPTIEQHHAPPPSFPSEAFPLRAAGFPARDSIQPVDRSTTSAGSAPDQSSQASVETVSETSRRLEQTARDLETSLTHLFNTQIESLQRLRDRVDEQERRWVEQQSARRAAL